MQVRDEVCGMQFPAEQALGTTELNGRTFYFCSERCREHFVAHPGWYVPEEARSESAS